MINLPRHIFIVIFGMLYSFKDVKRTDCEHPEALHCFGLSGACVGAVDLSKDTLCARGIGICLHSSLNYTPPEPRWRVARLFRVEVSGPERVCVHELPCWDVRTCLKGFSGTECQVIWASNTVCVCLCMCVSGFVYILGTKCSTLIMRNVPMRKTAS